MPQLLRKAAALGAAYSIALQVLLSGFVLGAHAGVDASAVICASDSAGNHNGPPQQHGSDCSICSRACGDGAPIVIPSDAKSSSVPFADRMPSPTPWAEALPSPEKHQPQSSRAPPHQA